MARKSLNAAPLAALSTEVCAVKPQHFEQTPRRGDSSVCLRIGGRELPRWLGTFVVCLATITPPAAHAVDGCTVLLCLAAPSWRSIEQCVSPVRQLMRDLARGKPFPTCAMSGAANSASHTWSAAPDFCPPQYTRIHDGPNGAVYTCDYAGAITVTVDGSPFARTWWSLDGDSVTEFSPAAKEQLDTLDRRFDDELAAWLASRPVTALPNR